MSNVSLQVRNRIEFAIYVLGVAALGLFLGMYPVSWAGGLVVALGYLLGLRLVGLLVRRAVRTRQNE